jgi:CheY-like chemotaxis protein
MSEEKADPKVTVLVVDDEDLLVELLCEFISDLGYAAIPASSAEIALAIIKTSTQVDLLITDVMMPGTDGIELAFKARQVLCCLPILIMSGFAPRLLEARQNVPSGARFVQKPFTFETIEHELNHLLRGQLPPCSCIPSESE